MGEPFVEYRVASGNSYKKKELQGS